VPGLGKPAAQQLGPGQVPAGDGFQQPLALTKIGQGPAAERDRALGVPAELGQGSTPERYRRGDVRQQARVPAYGRLEVLLISTRDRTVAV
jgi:hypothetical protein